MIPLETAIAPSLKEKGFKKKAKTWWRQSPDVIQVLNLQKSPYGDNLYVNLGIYLKALGEEKAPPENRCHVRVRLERVALEERQRSVAAASASEAPSQPLLDAVLTDGVSWLDALGTHAGIRQYLEAGGSKKGLVFREVANLVSAAK